MCAQVSPNNDSCSSDSNFFPSFLPSHPGPPVSVLLCCFKICMSLRNASHGSKLCVSQPPTWWNDPFKAGSICLNLHSSSLSKASGFGTQPRNILIKAHCCTLFSTGEEAVGSSQALSTADGWRFTAGKEKKSKAHFDALPLFPLLLLSLFPCVRVCVCVWCVRAQGSCVFFGLKRIKPRGVSEKARERARGEEGYIRKKWKRVDVCLYLCVRASYIYRRACARAFVITTKLISTWQ